MYFHGTVRDRTATVWRRCSVDVDRWRCRPDVEGGPLIRSNFYLKKKPKKKINLAKKFVLKAACSLIRSNTVIYISITGYSQKNN